MKTVIIVSKCFRVTKLGLDENVYEFHFKGVYSGESIRKVLLEVKSSFSLKINEEYLMSVQLISCEKGVLRGTLIKVKALDECWDRS